MTRVKDLSKATAQLNVDAPAHEHLVSLLNANQEQNLTEQQQKKKKQRVQPNEEEQSKAKDWHSRYTALQQNKKLALVEWNRLACGRRRLNALRK